MKFFVPVVALLASVASAADVCGAIANPTCGGTLVCCNGIPSGACCNFGQAVSSVRFSIPANSRGQGFAGSSCDLASPFSQVTTTAQTVICGEWAAARASWVEGLEDVGEVIAVPQACHNPNAMILADGTRVPLKLKRNAECI